MSWAALDGRVALVTGGSRGIGRGIAVELARAGARVVFTYRSSPEAARETAEIASGSGAEARPAECDVSDFEATEALVGEIQAEFGRLDIAVNNAGVTRDQLIVRMKPEDFDGVIATNLRGTWNVCRCVARPMLKQRWGRIVNLSSVVVGMGNPGQSNYAASKGGIEAMTRSLAMELGGRGITVNAVAPGYIETEMTAELPESRREALLGQVPSGRLGTVDDVAGSVRFLASEQAGYITGQVLAVNGGLDT